MNDQTVNKPKRRRRIIIVLIIIVICLAAAAVLLLLPKGGNEPAPEPAKGVVGRISDNWEPDVSRPSDDSDVSETKRGTQIPGYSSAVMHEGDRSLTLRIGNPPTTMSDLSPR